jgi:hypothetical protein
VRPVITFGNNINFFKNHNSLKVLHIYSIKVSPPPKGKFWVSLCLWPTVIASGAVWPSYFLVMQAWKPDPSKYRDVTLKQATNASFQIHYTA